MIPGTWKSEWKGPEFQTSLTLTAGMPYPPTNPKGIDKTHPFQNTRFISHCVSSSGTAFQYMASSQQPVAVA